MDQRGPKNVGVDVLKHYCKSNELYFFWFTLWQV